MESSFRDSLEGIRASLIATEAIDQVWDLVEDELVRAIHRNHQDDIEHVYEGCKSGEYQLWTMTTADNRLIFTVVTQMQVWPSGWKTLRITYGGGGKLQVLRAGVGMIEDWAREQDCQSVEIYGRKGWERVMKDAGFKPVSVILEKRLE